MATLRLAFDLSAEPRSKLPEWNDLLSRIAPHGVSASIVSRAEDADVVIATRGTSSYVHLNAAVKPLHRSCAKEATPRHIVWDKQDQPAGLEPGLYCSLPASLYEPHRHRTAPYPFTFNRCVEEYDLGDARGLLAFHGGLTHPLRQRIVDTIGGDSRAIIRVQGGFKEGEGGLRRIRSNNLLQQSYAETLRRCKFFLCPRGVGTGSIRLFETLKAARVPVLISDDYVLPGGVDWHACAVIVAERDTDRLMSIVAKREQDWPLMAEAARAAWTDRYSDAALLDTLASDVEAIAGGPTAAYRTRVARSSLDFAVSRIIAKTRRAMARTGD